MARPRLANLPARRLFLHRHALLDSPGGPVRQADLLALVRRLGFVQVDSVSTVGRAHDMIAFARRPAYRPGKLHRMLESGLVFEHWTHDAAIIPTEFRPHWQVKFRRDAARMRDRWPNWQGDAFLAALETVLDHVTRHGAVTSAEMKEAESAESTGWWDWHPSKAALEYLWRSGDLAIARREGFRKVYDLPERVLPEAWHAPSEADSLNWLNAAALDRLGFATSGEIAAFWGIVRPEEAKAWCAAECAAGRLEEIEVEQHNGTLRLTFARPEAVEEAEALPPAPKRLRVLSPFDPALRDRARAERLFGFRYRIEIFVPAPQRIYGYYVFPLLEGERIVGRIDMKARREADVLEVTRLWPEHGVRFGAGRIARLEAELERVARFAGVTRVVFGPDWLSEPKL